MRPAPSGQILNPFLDIARTLALEAGRQIMTLRDKPLERQRKPDHSLVTNADLAADKIIRDGLQKAFPKHSILTEESGLLGPAEAEYLWVVDPVDGTHAYARGVTGFSVMIGLLRFGKPYIGVVYDPLEGQLYEAAKGEGMQRHVSARADLAQMPVTTSTGFPKAVETQLRKSLPGPWIPAVNSVGVKVGYCVSQVVDIYINHHSVHYWDTCAPQIILEEAGGIITYLDGTPLEYLVGGGTYQHRGPTLATNGTRHQEILAVVEDSLK